MGLGLRKGGGTDTDTDRQTHMHIHRHRRRRRRRHTHTHTTPQHHETKQPTCTCVSGGMGSGSASGLKYFSNSSCWPGNASAQRDQKQCHNESCRHTCVCFASGQPVATLATRLYLLSLVQTGPLLCSARVWCKHLQESGWRLLRACPLQTQGGMSELWGLGLSTLAWWSALISPAAFQSSKPAH